MALTAETTAVANASSTAARDSSSCPSRHRSSMRSRWSPCFRAKSKRPRVLSSPSRTSSATPAARRPMSPNDGVRPRTSSRSAQAAKSSMLLRLRSAAFLERGVIGEDAEQRCIGVAVEEHRGADQVFERSVEDGPCNAFIESGGPKISVPARTRPGTAATTWRIGPSADSLASATRPTSQSAALPTSVVVVRGQGQLVDLAAPEIGDQDTGGLHAEADAHHVPRRPGDVQIGGRSAAAGDLVEAAVHDEPVRPELLHGARHRRLAQAREVDELVPRQGRTGEDDIKDRRLVVVARGRRGGHLTSLSRRNAEVIGAAQRRPPGGRPWTAPR